MVWHWIKKSARKRGLEFNLPKEKFFKLLRDSGYVENSGRLRDQLQIDRIDCNRGYTMDNIQIITKQENMRKYWDEESKIKCAIPQDIINYATDNVQAGDDLPF